MISRRILVISRSPALSRAIQASLGPGYEVVTSGDVIDVVEDVQEQGPFDVVVAGPAFDSHAGMARLATLRATAAVPAVVLALGPKPKANLSDIVRTGAVSVSSASCCTDCRWAGENDLDGIVSSATRP